MQLPPSPYDIGMAISQCYTNSTEHHSALNTAGRVEGLAALGNDY